MTDHVMSSERADGLLNKSWDSTDIKHDYAAALRTVIAQSEQIETLSRLLSGAEEAAIERAEQIERVREARSMINRIIANAERGVDLGDPVTLAKSIVNKLNEALGDTDD